MGESWKEDIVKAAQGSRVNHMIGRYLLEHEDETLFLTAQGLANKAGVSQGSVTRFCAALGYAGYGEFQKKMQQSRNGEQATAVERLQYLKDIDQSDIDIIESEKAGMDRLYDVIRSEDYQYLIGRLISAERVYLVSARLSATVQQYLFYGLSKLRDQVTLLQRSTVLWDTIDYADPAGALVLAVSFPRYSAELIDKLSHLERNGYEIFSITDGPLSPAAQRSAHSLMAPLTRRSIFDVYSTPVLLFNLILKDVAAGIPDLESRMIRMEQDEKAHRVYYDGK